MKSKNLICLATLILFAPAVLASTTWDVNGASGSDSNNCLSPQDPCKTIGHAISLAASGDTIMVAAATYTEGLMIGVSLRIVGSSAQTTIIEGGAFRAVTVSSASAQVILSNLTIRNSKISVLCGSPGGAGVYNKGTLTITNSIISGNSAYAHPLFHPIYPYGANVSCGIEGGGILNNGTLAIDNSTVSGNGVGFTGCVGLLPIFTFCNATGGGIASTGGTLTINSSTISGNVAGGSACVPYHCRLIGGIFATGVVSNSTISGNLPNGIDGTTLQNTIVADNGYTNCFGSVISKGYNLSSDGTCHFNAPGDLNNHDPLLGPLQNNGGPTPTMALLPGSPAIDAGDPSGCTDGSGHLLTTDQRGMPRPDKEDTGRCDLGAYELQSD